MCCWGVWHEYEIFMDGICFSRWWINHTQLFPEMRGLVSTRTCPGGVFTGESIHVNSLTCLRFQMWLRCLICLCCVWFLRAQRWWNFSIRGVNRNFISELLGTRFHLYFSTSPRLFGGVYLFYCSGETSGKKKIMVNLHYGCLFITNSWKI